MNRWRVILVGGSAAAAVAAGGLVWVAWTAAEEREAPATRPAETLDAGLRVWERVCASCHGRRGEGVVGLAPDMRDSAFVRQRSDSELVEFIRRGRMPFDAGSRTGLPMPPKGGDPRLTDEQLAAVVEHLRALVAE